MTILCVALYFGAYSFFESCTLAGRTTVEDVSKACAAFPNDNCLLSTFKKENRTRVVLYLGSKP